MLYENVLHAVIFDDTSTNLSATAVRQFAILFTHDVCTGPVTHKRLQ